MKRILHSKRFWRIGMPGTVLLFLGQCNALSDAQLTSIAQSAVSTSLNALVTNVISVFFSGLTAGA